MLKIVEAFSGIGSQAKALKLLKEEIALDYEIINIIEWDINAIYAYDIIHNGKQDLTKYEGYSREELLDMLEKYPLSYDGKTLISKKHFNGYPEEALKAFLFSIERTKNLVSIKDVNAQNFNDRIDILTYSFPCQDLSISGYFHGDRGGIDRKANNSSSMLWEVERILLDFSENNLSMPKVLIMENVTNIKSPQHIENFNEWISSLENMGYVSKDFDLQATDFGIPQTRKRTFMLSFFCGSDEELKQRVRERLFNSPLNNPREMLNIAPLPLKNLLRVDYDNETYKHEARLQVPNNTPSRKKIFENNPVIVDENFEILAENVRTITTRQDRHPNSGVLNICKTVLNLEDEKSSFRYLTAREAFLLMGFKEEDYQKLIDNNFSLSSKRMMFTMNKLLKVAGNSIVVNVMKEVMREAINIHNELLTTEVK